MTIPFVQNLRLHGKLPRIDHSGPTYPMLVRDGLLSRIKALPYFASFNFTSNKSMPIQIQSIPFCGVYLLQEFMAPDGDADAGEPRFRTSVRYGFSVIVQNNDPDAAEVQLDKAMDALSRGLFTDPTVYNNSKFQIQGFTGGSRQHVFGHIGMDQQTPIAELRWELMCDLGTIDYPPVIPDVLEVIHVQTAFPIDGDASRVQQVIRQYDMEVSTVGDGI